MANRMIERPGRVVAPRVWKHPPHRALAVAGRVLIALLFLVSGFNKLPHWGETAGYMASMGMNAVPLWLFLATAIEIVGGAALAFGVYYRTFAVLLALYLVPVTFIFHGFWRFEGMEAMIQSSNFLKNLAIIGGLLLVAAFKVEYRPHPETTGDFNDPKGIGGMEGRS